jgi:hypothetical protein
LKEYPTGRHAEDAFRLLIELILDDAADAAEGGATGNSLTDIY